MLDNNEDIDLDQALERMMGESKKTFEEMKTQTEKTLSDLELEVEKFTDSTSDRIAELLDPTRIQEVTAQKALKKLRAKKAEWKPYDYGLGNISQIVETLSGTLPSPELLPSSSMHPSLESNGKPTEQQHNQQTAQPTPQEPIKTVPVEAISVVPEMPLTEEISAKHPESLIDPVDALRKAKYAANGKKQKSANPA